jgi:orotate phosphoribosyltransferase
MEAASLESLVREHAPVRRGHFLLSSGMHTPYYVELEAIVQNPDLTATICRAIADRFREQQPQAVLAALGPDAILGYEVARQLNARAIFADGPLGRRMLRPRFHVTRGERVLILMGVIVTGDSARELVRLVGAAEGQVTGVAVLVDRSGGPLQLGVPVEPLAVFDLEAYLAPVCPLCSEGQPLERRIE